MAKKNGSQVRDIFGEEVKLIAGTLISKKDAQKAIERKLGVTDRQARASVSSYRAEGWTEGPADQRLSLNDGLADVSSFENRVLIQVDARYDASVENGKQGGAPSKTT